MAERLGKLPKDLYELFYYQAEADFGPSVKPKYQAKVIDALNNAYNTQYYIDNNIGAAYFAGGYGTPSVDVMYEERGGKGDIIYYMRGGEYGRDITDEEIESFFNVLRSAIKDVSWQKREALLKFRKRAQEEDAPAAEARGEAAAEAMRTISKLSGGRRKTRTRRTKKRGTRKNGFRKTR